MFKSKILEILLAGGSIWLVKYVLIYLELLSREKNQNKEDEKVIGIKKRF